MKDQFQLTLYIIYFFLDLQHQVESSKKTLSHSNNAPPLVAVPKAEVAKTESNDKTLVHLQVVLSDQEKANNWTNLRLWCILYNDFLNIFLVSEGYQKPTKPSVSEHGKSIFVY